MSEEQEQKIKKYMKLKKEEIALMLYHAENMLESISSESETVKQHERKEIYTHRGCKILSVW